MPHEYALSRTCASPAAADALQDTRSTSTSAATPMRTLISRYSAKQPRTFVIAGVALIALTAVVGMNVSGKRAGRSALMPSLGSLIERSPGSFDTAATQEKETPAAPA